MQLVVFTDLDGTLLDHETYSFSAAQDALNLLSQKGIPLVLASSKTSAEIAPLHAKLGLGTTPAIVENGAGLYDPTIPPHAENAKYKAIRAILDAIDATLRHQFEGFGDMSVSRVADLTGLTPEDAARAKDRCFSEPGLWHGDDGSRETFLKTLAELGLTARQGGRFLTLSHGQTKADAMSAVIKQLNGTITLALGDAPNDAEMLAAADHAVIIRNDHGPDFPDISTKGTLFRTNAAGPEGWNSAVLRIVKQLYGQKDG